MIIFCDAAMDLKPVIINSLEIIHITIHAGMFNVYNPTKDEETEAQTSSPKDGRTTSSSPSASAQRRALLLSKVGTPEYTFVF